MNILGSIYIFENIGHTKPQKENNINLCMHSLEENVGIVKVGIIILALSESPETSILFNKTQTAPLPLVFYWLEIKFIFRP